MTTDLLKEYRKEEILFRKSLRTQQRDKNYKKNKK
jgi:hypothetical protein